MNATCPFLHLRVSDTTERPGSYVAQLAMLRLLNEQPALSQRELSTALNLSLGKTHYVLHALLDRGLVKARNFHRNSNKVAYSYLLTPAGMREKLILTRRFLASKEAEFEQLQAAIVALRAEMGTAADAPIPADRTVDLSGLQTPNP